LRLEIDVAVAIVGFIVQINTITHVTLRLWHMFIPTRYDMARLGRLGHRLHLGTATCKNEEIRVSGYSAPNQPNLWGA